MTRAEVRERVLAGLAESTAILAARAAFFRSPEILTMDEDALGRAFARREAFHTEAFLARMETLWTCDLDPIEAAVIVLVRRRPAIPLLITRWSYCRIVNRIVFDIPDVLTPEDREGDFEGFGASLAGTPRTPRIGTTSIPSTARTVA